MGGEGKWKTVRSDWREVVLVCRKCSKKLDGGFGPDGDEGLAKALRRALDDRTGGKTKARRRAVAVVDVGCLDLCPKKAVVVVRAGDPERMVLVPKGADVAEISGRLGLPSTHPAGGAPARSGRSGATSGSEPPPGAAAPEPVASGR